MKKLLSILIVHCALCTVNLVRADVVVLQSGQTMQGEIVMQNDEVILLRDAGGHRYQFLQSEVQSIQADSVLSSAPLSTSDTQHSKVSLRLDVAGGALFVPSYNTGGFFSADLAIGTRNLANRRIFLGGSIGYQFTNSSVATPVAHQSINHFIPLMAVVSVPLTEGKHAPEIGAGIGYGFAVKSPQKGGMTAQLDLSWRYQYSASSALLLGVRTRFQQAKVDYTEVIDEKEYNSTQGRCFVSVGVHLSLLF